MNSARVPDNYFGGRTNQRRIAFVQGGRRHGTLVAWVQAMGHTEGGRLMAIRNSDGAGGR